MNNIYIFMSSRNASNIEKTRVKWKRNENNKNLSNHHLLSVQNDEFFYSFRPYLHHIQWIQQCLCEFSLSFSLFVNSFRPIVIEMCGKKEKFLNKIRDQDKKKRVSINASIYIQLAMKWRENIENIFILVCWDCISSSHRQHNGCQFEWMPKY